MYSCCDRIIPVKLETGIQKIACRQFETRQKLTVCKEKALLELPVTYSEREQKIIAIAVCQIKKSDSVLYPVIAQPKDLADLLYINLDGLYGEIKNIIELLRRPALLPIIKNEKVGHETYPFFKFIERYRGDVIFQINDNLSPFILPSLHPPYSYIVDNYRARFKKYPLRHYLMLSGKYTLRMYELLCLHEFKKYIDIPLDTLRLMLNITQKFNEYKDFKKNILDKAYAEINCKTNLRFEYETYKTRNKISSIRFLVKIRSS
jgi:plasmid replication initiation protein